MEREQSVVVIKPDGIKTGNIRPLLLKFLAARSLSIVKEYEFACDARRVLDIWPMFGLRGHRVMREMYVRYMGSGHCAALLVEGVEALTACRQIKKMMRKDFEVCAFENAIHAPEDEAERASNISQLFGDRSIAVPEDSWPGWTNRGQFGKAADASDEEIVELADRIWAERLLGNWTDTFLSSCSQGSHKLVLRPGDPNSIDFGLSALLETDARRSLDDVVRLYIESEVAGGAALACGDPCDLEPAKSALIKLRMKVDVVDSRDEIHPKLPPKSTHDLQTAGERS